MKIERICENCNSTFFVEEKHLNHRKYPNLCRSCIASTLAKVTYSKYTFDFSTMKLDKENFVATDCNGTLLSVKVKFKIECENCNTFYWAALGFERDKKYPWHCKSCAIKKCWCLDDYRNNHIETLKKTFENNKRFEQCSEQSKKNWSNLEIRERMLDRDRTIATLKSIETKKRNLLSGKTTLKAAHGKRCLYENDDKKIYFRSTYELRFAHILDKQNYEWSYESKSFLVCNDNKIYIPDFEIPNLGFVEVKGWWRDDAREKYDSYQLNSLYPKLVLVTKNELIQLEMGDIKIEDLFD